MDNNENMQPEAQPNVENQPIGAVGTMRSFGILRLPWVRNPRVGIGVLFGLFFIMMMIVSIMVMLIGRKTGSSISFMRIATVLQDLLVFIFPAIIAAFSVTRLPASLLTIDVKPNIRATVIALMTLVVAMPALELIVDLNQNMHLPEALSGLEKMLRDMEDSAADAVGTLAGESSIGNLIMGILIIGLLTGVSEELFFRGALQNLLFSGRMNKHLCIWITAAVFSFMHFQFFGFVPRMLLGAYFGYLLWWTGSVWVPIMAHALNNSMAVVAQSMSETSTGQLFDDGCAGWGIFEWTMVAVSVILTIVLLKLLKRVSDSFGEA